ncbi:MAG: hypothetical protein K9G67_16135 [Bacteroidales bacterium]|nr:hypothetical protein [Bacteroidales bacterium]MCF8352333.1 hypothetical protein [Bacteroidales bacterium]MCF8377886.1 hypothetical protein [Bacteroidales bacterium]
MVVIIKKGTGKERLNEMLKQFKRRKRFNANRFLGKVQWKEDALAYQKRIRNEWD